MTLFVVDRIRKPRSVWNKGNGHVLTTDYESITITLDKEVTAEEGTILFADPGTLNPGDIIEINFQFFDLKEEGKGEFHEERCCPCTIDGCIHIEVPDPMPDNLGAYVGDMARRYSMFLANLTHKWDEDTATITYKMIRSGWRFEITSDVTGLITQTPTVIATVGNMPSIGNGSALFYKPDKNLMTIPDPSCANLNSPGVIRPLIAATGYASPDPVPCFFGVLRWKERWTEICDLPCCMPLYDCDEGVRRGTIQIPLEENAPDSYAECPGIVARYAADGTYTRTGGFRILPTPADPVPAGMIPVPNGEILMIHPEKRSAVLRLR